MESSSMTRVITPLVIAFIMYGMGLSLTREDFRRVWLQPRVIFTGAALQIMGLPALGFAFATLLGLSPVLSTSIMLLSACPGGAITNLVSYVARGDAALSVSLTAVNSLITVVTIPLIITFSLGHFMGEAVAAQVEPLKLCLGIITVTIPPIMMGMFTRSKAPGFAERAEPVVKKGTILLLACLATIAFIQEIQLFLDNFQDMAIIALSLCLCSMLLGAGFGWIFRFSGKQILTLGIEVGLHNSAMGIVIAISFLDMNCLAIFSAFYLITEYILSGLLIGIMNSPLGATLLRANRS